ncbi:MAG: hypothetical protein MJA83_03685, partial [Gammaproteobacteria bacterium]|nr:hypothetical protein [Gammaproteobacteria bacterium]
MTKRYIERNYEKIQVIAYQIPTDIPSDPAINFPMKYDPLANTDYPRVPADNEVLSKNSDALNRLKLLAQTVNFARTALKEKNNGMEVDNTLKIFMAPEFFFRPREVKDPHAPNIELPRSYTAEVKTEIVKALRAMFIGDAYKNWLIVPGTIVWTTTGKSLYKGYEDKNILDGEELQPEDVEAQIIMNSVVAVKGGDLTNVKDEEEEVHEGQEGDEKKDAVVPWTIAHKINYADTDLKKDADQYDPLKKDSLALSKIVGSYEHKKSSIKEIDRLNIGLEVDKDHFIDLHVLKSTNRKRYEKEHEVIHEFPVIDLHLLVACGQEIIETSVAAAKGRYILRMDGKLDDKYLPLFRFGEVGYQKGDDINVEVPSAIEKAGTDGALDYLKNNKE